ncbi:MAG: alpha/beta hydrolase [Desulfobacterales bacterium]|nr:alpha/beta hydrolase [Desulfobacterales bacterium]
MNNRIFYKKIETSKEKPWLTMIHGFSHNHKYFSKQIEEFKKNFNIFLLDLRGHGKSEIKSGPFGIEEYADDIFSSLKEAEIARTNYWGTHTGSAIGLVLSLRYPTLIESLVLEGTFLPGYSMPRVSELLEKAKTIVQKNGVDVAITDWYKNADWFSYINKYEKCRVTEYENLKFQGLPWLCETIPKEVTNVADNLARIEKPVLVYNGENDMPDFKRAADKLEGDLPYSIKKIISSAGAFPAWENYNVVNKVVKDFFQKIDVL